MRGTIAGAAPGLATALTLATVLTLSACGEPPALEVGPVAFAEADISLMSETQLRQLEDLAAFGVVVSRERQDSLAAPFVRRELRSLALQRLAVESAVADAGMDEEALREAYQRDPVPELVVRHLVVMSERWRPDAHRDSSRAVAEEALSRARTGEPFDALAGEYSDEPGADERGGLLRPGREGTWAREFWNAAVALEEGEISSVVETEFGFHVIQLEERRAVPFDEVREEVLERFVDLPSALRQVTGPSNHRAAVRVDTAAVTAWVAGDTVATPLAAWEPDGSLTVPAFQEYVATLEREVRQEVRTDPALALARVETAARDHRLAGEATAAGWAPSAADRSALEDRWHRQVERWADALGFAGGMSAEAVGQAALAALGSPRQGAAIARRELGQVSGVLRLMVPVSRQSSSSSDVVNSATSG